MTKLTEKQESLLNELLEDLQGNTEAVCQCQSKNGQKLE